MSKPRISRADAERVSDLVSFSQSSAQKSARYGASQTFHAMRALACGLTELASAVRALLDTLEVEADDDGDK